jgi:hypothetical protein
MGLEEPASVYARFLYRCLLKLVDLSHEGRNIEFSLAETTIITRLAVRGDWYPAQLVDHPGYRVSGDDRTMA